MSHRKISFGALAAIGLLGTILGTADASAADLDPVLEDAPQVMPQSNVVFGSGWYIRGDIGATRGAEVATTDPTLGGVPNFSFDRSHNIGYVASIGGGYAINNWFRTDAVFDFHQPVTSARNGNGFTCAYGAYGLPVGGPYSSVGYQTEHCNSSLSGALKSYDVLFNGYIDLGNWHGVTPYVGAGVGLSFGHYQTAVNYYYPNGAPYDFNYTDPVSGASLNENFDRNASGTYYNPAFALMAGVSIDVFDHTKLDVGYRYVNLGRVMGSTLSTQEVRAGLRYMIDN